jgi:hypothetical protein
MAHLTAAIVQHRPINETMLLLYESKIAPACAGVNKGQAGQIEVRQEKDAHAGEKGRNLLRD